MVLKSASLKPNVATSSEVRCANVSLERRRLV